MFSNYDFSTSIANYSQVLQEQANMDDKIMKRQGAARNRVKENSRLLPQFAIDVMKKWYDEHYTNPYPTYRDCEMLAESGRVSINQVKQWFVNVRRRSHNEFRRRRTVKDAKRRKNANNSTHCQFDEATSKSTSLSSDADISLLNEFNALSEILSSNVKQDYLKPEKQTDIVSNVSPVVAPSVSSSNSYYDHDQLKAYNYYSQYYNGIYNSPQQPYNYRSVTSSYTSTPSASLVMPTPKIQEGCNYITNTLYNNSVNSTESTALNSSISYNSNMYDYTNYYSSYYNYNQSY